MCCRCYVLEVAPAARADLCRQLQLALPMLPEFGKTDSANDLHCLRQHLCFHQVGSLAAGCWVHRQH